MYMVYKERKGFFFFYPEINFSTKLVRNETKSVFINNSCHLFYSIVNLTFAKYKSNIIALVTFDMF